MEFLNFFGNKNDPFGIGYVNDSIENFCDALNVPTLVGYICGIVLAVLVGFLAYKLVRVVTAVAMGAFGYYCGAAVFGVIAENFSGLPSFLEYVAGGVVALVFLIIGAKKAAYVWYLLAAVGGYAVASAFADGKMMIGLFGGAILAIFAVYAPKFMFILYSSVAVGVLTVNFVGHIADLEIFQLDTNYIAVIIAAAIAVFFTLIQCAINRKAKALR